MPRPWSHERNDCEHKTDDGSPVFTPEAGHPVLDLSHESQHEDEYQVQSSAGRAALLHHLGEQLMLACAEECPELQEEIDVASAHILAVTKRLTERSQEHVLPRGKHGVSIHMPEYPTGTGELLGATAAPSEHRVHTDHLDPVYDSGPSGYSLTEPDVGLFSVDTPFHDGISSARSVSQVTTRTATCTTATVTVGHPLMSVHAPSAECGDTYGRGNIPTWSNLDLEFSLNSCCAQSYRAVFKQDRPSELAWSGTRFSTLETGV